MNSLAGLLFALTSIGSAAPEPLARTAFFGSKSQIYILGPARALTTDISGLVDGFWLRNEESVLVSRMVQLGPLAIESVVERVRLRDGVRTVHARFAPGLGFATDLQSNGDGSYVVMRLSGAPEDSPTLHLGRFGRGEFVEGSDNVRFLPSPSGPLALLYRPGGEPDERLELVDTRTGARRLVAPAPGPRAGDPVWAPDGGSILVRTESRPAEARRYDLAGQSWSPAPLAQHQGRVDQLIEVATRGTPFEVIGLPATREAAPILRFALDGNGAERVPNVPVMTHWYAGGTHPFPSPSRRRLLFQYEGAIMLAEIRLGNIQEVNQLLEREERTDLMSQAKQVGIGLMMFAADNDGNLPFGEDVPSQILPYLRNRDLLIGFTYSPPGERNMDRILEPSKTVIGYVQGRMGRAVMFADGSVRWVSNP